MRSSYVHCQEEDTTRNHRRIIHRVRRHGQIRRQRENHRNEQRPDDTVEVHRPPKQSVAEVKRSRFELHLWVVLEYAAERDGDDVRDVERHRGEREYGIRRDRGSKVEQAGENAQEGREPNGAKGRVRPFGNMAKVAVVRETCNAWVSRVFVLFCFSSDL